MQFIVCNSYEEISRRGAEIIAEVMKKKPACILGLATGAAVYFSLTYAADMKGAGVIVLAVLSMFLVQLIVMLVLRKVSAKINNVLQATMMETANKLRAMQEQYMRRPVGSQKQMM